MEAQINSTSETKLVEQIQNDLSRTSGSIWTETYGFAISFQFITVSLCTDLQSKLELNPAFFNSFVISTPTYTYFRNRFANTCAIID